MLLFAKSHLKYPMLEKVWNNLKRGKSKPTDNMHGVRHQFHHSNQPQELCQGGVRWCPFSQSIYLGSKMLNESSNRCPSCLQELHQQYNRSGHRCIDPMLLTKKHMQKLQPLLCNVIEKHCCQCRLNQTSDTTEVIRTHQT